MIQSDILEEAKFGNPSCLANLTCKRLPIYTSESIYLVDKQVHKQPVQSATINSTSQTPELTDIAVNYVSQAIVTEEINNMELKIAGECQQRSLFHYHLLKRLFPFS